MNAYASVTQLNNDLFMSNRISSTRLFPTPIPDYFESNPSYHIILYVTTSVCMSVRL